MSFYKGTVIFLLGVISGGLIVAKTMEEHYMQMADEEINEMKKHIRELNKPKEDTKISDKPERETSSIEPKNKYNSIIRDYTKPEREVIDPGFSTKVNVEKPSIDSIVKPWKGDDEEMVEAPYVITDEEFAEDNGYGKETVWLYEEDKALIGDNDEIIDNDEDCIGKAILNDIQSFFKEGTTIYIRNDVMQIDFEVNLQRKSYSRDVLGLED